MPGRADALREMAAITAVIGQLPGQRPAAFWLEVARIVCERHGIKSLNAHAPDNQPAKPPPPVLTKRERERLTLLAQGFTAQQIATRDGYGYHAIKSSLTKTYRVLGATNAAHAVALALRAGLID